MWLKVKEVIDLIEKGVKDFNVPEDAVIGAIVRGKIETFKRIRFDLDDFDDYGWWLSIKKGKKNENFEIDITDEGVEVESLKEWKKSIKQHQPSSPIRIDEFLYLLKNTFDDDAVVFCNKLDVDLTKDDISYDAENNVMVIAEDFEKNVKVGKLKNIVKEVNVLKDPTKWEIAEDQKNVPDGMVRVVTSDLPRMTVKDVKNAIKSLSDDDYVVITLDDRFYCGISTSINTDNHVLEITRNEYGNTDTVDYFKLVNKKEFEAAKSKIEIDQVLGYVMKRSKIVKLIMRTADGFVNDPEFSKLSSFKIAVRSKMMYLDMLHAPSQEKIDTHIDVIHNTINDKLKEKNRFKGYELEVANVMVTQHRKDAVSLDVGVKITKL